jgi:transposase
MKLLFAIITNYQSPFYAILLVSRAGYYKWKNNVETRYFKEIKYQEDFNIILEAFNYRGYDKGIKGINMRLLK